MADFKVNLIGWTGDPQLLSVAGALGCFEEKSSAQICEELQQLSPDKRIKKEKAVLKNSFGRGHGAVGDQNYFIFSIENLPRLATLQLCLPEYLAHLQQSLRRAKASRGFYLSEEIKNLFCPVRRKKYFQEVLNYTKRCPKPAFREKTQDLFFLFAH